MLQNFTSLHRRQRAVDCSCSAAELVTSREESLCPQSEGSGDRGSAENSEESGGNGTHQLLNTEYKYFSFSPRLYKYWEGGITVETDSGCSVHFINQAFSDVFCAVGFSADSQPW